jgi:cytochrome c oxidase assembly protein subunit 15
MRLPVAENRAGATAPSAPRLRSAQHRRFRVFAWGVLAYNVAVILWGALVRATGSGAGCGGHWPLCNGDVLPDIAQIGTVIELTHRVMSGLALLLVAAMLVWARKVYPAGHPARRWATWSIVFILTEALLGASLVLLGHVAGNESVGRVYSLAAHLINTFLLLGSLTLSAWSATRIALPASEPRNARPLSLSGLGPLIALVLVAVAGAITALGDTLFPTHTFAEGLHDDFSSTASFLIRLRIIHPLLAAAAGCWIAGVAVLEYRANRTPGMQALSRWLLALFAIQIAVGGASILLQAPVPIQLLHLLIADVIWITLVLFTAERRIAEIQ